MDEEFRQKRRLRGWILQVLAQSSVSTKGGGRMPVGDEMLARTVCGLALREIEPTELHTEVGYLKDKEYVAMERLVDVPSAVARFGKSYAARITARGQDLIDGLLEEPAIDFGAFRRPA